jgi:lipoate---protein ligase
MYCLSLLSHDPYFNLAVEEYLLRNKKEEYLILGINSCSVIIGKHQSAHREINTKYITEQNIPVVRRITGGGTVFHDMGNLNFTFIRQCEQGRQVDFRRYTQPVIEFLSSQGVEVKFEGKNDLKINGLKISGNAEHVYGNRVIHHGTLLFNASLEEMGWTLRKVTSCYITRAVISNPSSVSNLNELLPGMKDVFEFREAMINYFLKALPGAEKIEINEAEMKEINLLADSKYRSWEWNWAYGPEYLFIKQFYYQENSIFCKLTVKDGIIRECILEGDGRLAGIPSKLIGCRHMVDDMKNIFDKENITDIEIFNFF